MTDVIRSILVDPNRESRDSLQRILGGVTSIWLSDVVNDYQEAGRRASEIGAHLTIVNLDHDSVQAIELIHQITSTTPGAVLLPASRSSDSGLILKAIRAGAREFLTLPVEPAELVEIIARLHRGKYGAQTDAAKGPRIITITGAAGGIGCTSLAVNLAVTLAADKSRESLLLDLDLMFGSIDACLDVHSDHTLTQVIQNFDRLDLTLLKRSITRHQSGLYLMPRPAAMQDAAAIDPDTLKRLLGLLRASFGTVVIDTSKGLTAADFTAFEMSDLILLVVQLDLMCMRNTVRLLNLFREYEGLAERVKVVANRVGSFDWEIGLKKAESTLKMPIAWQIPNAAKQFQEAILKGVPLVELAKGSRSHHVILEIARSLSPATGDAPKSKKGLFAAFF
jgi:pilus assembly protein CpaE